MEIIEVLVDYLGNPLGFNGLPRFGLIIRDDNQNSIKTKYHIIYIREIAKHEK
jgi:hypothetical protein